MPRTLCSVLFAAASLVAVVGLAACSADSDSDGESTSEALVAARPIAEDAATADAQPADGGPVDCADLRKKINDMTLNVINPLIDALNACRTSPQPHDCSKQEKAYNDATGPFNALVDEFNDKCATKPKPKPVEAGTAQAEAF